MGDLTQNTKTNIALKHLVGKSHTTNIKTVANEAEGIYLNIPSTAIFSNVVPSSATYAISLGIAEYITGATLTADITSVSGGTAQSYFATYPLWHSKSGQRIRNAISPSFGYEYEAKPYAGVNLISVGDDRNWFYQYNSGIFYQDVNTGSAPTTINLYAYTGQFLSDFVASGGTSSSVTWNSIIGTPTSLSGYGITDAYTVSEVNDLIDNYTLLTDFELHTGATNPHGTSFFDLTSTAHTHDDRYYTESEIDNLLTGVTNIFTGYTTLNTFNSHTGDTNNPHNVTISQISGVSLSIYNTYTGTTVPSTYATIVNLNSHTGSTNPHGTRLFELLDVNTGGTQQGYYLSYSAGTWVGVPDATDLSNYYNKSQVYNTGETYTKLEVDNLITGVTVDLSGYYTSAQTDQLLTAYVKLSGDSAIYGNITIESGYTLSATSIYTENITINSLTSTTNCIVESDPNGNLINSGKSFISAYIQSGSTVANLLENISNWDINGIYIGVVITGSYQGQKYYNNNYFFEAVEDNLFIRLIRG